MYYRRKLLLAILEKMAHKKIEKILLQKILFLIIQKQNKPCFDFVPYKYGCFSFQATKDLEVLSNHYAFIQNTEKYWTLVIKDTTYFQRLKEEDQNIINQIFQNFDTENLKQIINFVYNEYPYWTIYSERKLTQTQKLKQQEENKKIQTKKKQIFSIGYEGLSIDTYLNILIKNNVKLLCDVRRNPLSMKYGFSKNQLSKYCGKLDIKYIHISDLGIESKLRQNLTTQTSYDNLFKEYKFSLQEKKESLLYMKDLIEEYNRVAFTCFEKDYKCCHRNTLLTYYAKTVKKINPLHLQ